MSPFDAGAALVDASGLAVPLVVRGADAYDYLQRMVSCDLRRLAPEQGIRSTLLTGKGKLVAAFEVYPHEGGFLLMGEAAGAGLLRESLEKLIILEDVELRGADQLGQVLSLQGPKSADVLSRVGFEALPEDELGVRHAVWRGQRVDLFRRSRSSAGGWDLLAPSGIRSELETDLVEAGAERVSPEQAEGARIEAGFPRFGIDATNDTLPPEAGYGSALSYDKGCYSGQEVVARIRTYGHVNKLLFRLRFEGDRVPAAGDPIQGDSGLLGQITSAAVSPATGEPVALGYLRYQKANVGDRVRVGGEELVATVEGLNPLLDPEA